MLPGLVDSLNQTHVHGDKRCDRVNISYYKFQNLFTLLFSDQNYPL